MKTIIKYLTIGREGIDFLIEVTQKFDSFFGKYFKKGNQPEDSPAEIKGAATETQEAENETNEQP